MNLPNKLTVFRIFMIPVFLILMMLPSQSFPIFHFLGSEIPLTYLLAMLVFAIASFTDFLDGYLARKYHLVTNFGKFADPMADKLLVITAFIMLLAIGRIQAWMVVLIVCRELAVTGLRILLVQEGEVLAAALPGKIKTATQMLAIIFLLIDDAPFKNLGIPLGMTFMAICLFFTVYSGMDYFVKNANVFKQAD